MSEQERRAARPVEEEAASDTIDGRDGTLTTSDIAPAAPAAAGAGGAFGQEEEDSGRLFGGDETQTFRAQWDEVQTGFVDEPRKAVEQADTLVAEVIKRLAEIFADERNELERQWDRGDQVSTEDLRLALQRYRSFFSRLLTIERPPGT